MRTGAMEDSDRRRMHLRSKTRKQREEDKAIEGNAKWGRMLENHLEELKHLSSSKYPMGMRVWVKAKGYCEWPAVIWSIDLCLKKFIPEVLGAYAPEYHMHGKNRCWRSVCVACANRVYCKNGTDWRIQLWDGTMLTRFYGDHSSMWCEEAQLKEITEDYEERCEKLKQWGKQEHRQKVIDMAIEELETSSSDCQEEVQRMLQLQSDLLGVGRSTDVTCDLCAEIGATLKCTFCDRFVHPLCLTPPALTTVDVPNEGQWSCPCCGEANKIGEKGPGKEEEKCERMGLTPDWIIHTGAFRLFGLPEPTSEHPYIRGLLDPCTNSKIAPNIPAEIMYDKNDNGLKLSNVWAGYHIIMNPDYKSQVQWRFVNRAIDEVENDQVPAVLLVCRNSTDTAYFQRLTPYPRVFLKRQSAQFKDYDKTPIGFGIVLFCIAKGNCHDLYQRFMQYFGPGGEPNIVIDKALLAAPAFHSLLRRLRHYANEFHRDHWIQCNLCGKWRIIQFESMMSAKDSDWTCNKLRPPYTNCRTPQTKYEIMGARYAVHGDDDEIYPEDHREAACKAIHLHGRALRSHRSYTPKKGRKRGMREHWTKRLKQTPNTKTVSQQNHAQDGKETQLDTGGERGELMEIGCKEHKEQNQSVVNGSNAQLETQEQVEVARGVACNLDTSSASRREINPVNEEGVQQPGVSGSQNQEEDFDEKPTGTHCQVLTGLEFARQARMAANKAFLKMLEDGYTGDASVEDPVKDVREEAMQRAVHIAREQLKRCEQRYAVAHSEREEQEQSMKKILKDLKDDEAMERKRLMAAIKELEQIKAQMQL